MQPSMSVPRPARNCPGTGSRALAPCIVRPLCHVLGRQPRPRLPVLAHASESQEPEAEVGPSRNGDKDKDKASPVPVKPSRFAAWLPNKSSFALLASAASLLRSQLWPVLIIFAAKDTFSFILYRFSHRLTNIVAESALGAPLTQLGANPWWLYLEPGFLESNMGYQACIVAVFLLFLPASIFLDAAAWSATALICAPQAAKGSDTPVPPPTSSETSSKTTTPTAAGQGSDELEGNLPAAATPPSESGTPAAEASTAPAGTTSGTDGTTVPAGSSEASGQGNPVQASSSKSGLVNNLKQGVTDVLALLPLIAPIMHRVWWVGLLFNLQALPLQALSLLIIPLFWTVPKLMDIQLALPVAALEGAAGRSALDRSAQLMTSGLRSVYGWPFVVLILSLRLFDNLRTLTMAAMPQRWWSDVMEVPIVITFLLWGSKLLLIRLQDLLPLATYLMAISKEEETQAAL